MNRHTKKDALLHARLDIQHPSRADGLEREIKTTRHSRSTEESATSTTRPPLLMPPPLMPPPLMPPPLIPAQAARLPPLTPAQAAGTAKEKCMSHVLFKKPESYVRAKKLVTLQQPLADATVSKKVVNQYNDPLATFKNQEEREQFWRDQEEMKKFHQNRNAGSSTFSIDYLLSTNKNQALRNHIKNLRDVRKNFKLPVESGMSASAARTRPLAGIVCLRPHQPHQATS
jgi:hypothetical protein